tara:strand:- start:1 stop:795 length:795 start_codon:yes stop_codon:yes gene_type:complete
MTPEDLSAFARLTVVPGVTVGDLAFVQATSLFSTALIDITTINTIASNRRRRVFQTPIGKTGQGFGPAYALTESETNLQVDNFQMEGNEVFVATHACWSVCKRVSAGGAAANLGAADEMQNLIPSTDALWAILSNTYWEVTVGDDITRNYGLLKDYPQGGGVYGVPTMEAVTTGAAATGMIGYNTPIGAQSGSPSIHCSRPLALPIVAPPNIGVKIEARTGSTISAPIGVAHTGAAGTANWMDLLDYLQIRLVLEGYLFTMPVG